MRYSHVSIGIISVEFTSIISYVMSNIANWVKKVAIEAEKFYKFPKAIPYCISIHPPNFPSIYLKGMSWQP